MRRPALPTLVTTAVAALALLAGAGAPAAPAAHAATAKTPKRPTTPTVLPAGFVGMNADGPLLDDPRVDRGRELGRIRATGVTSVRAVFDWAAAQPVAATAPDLSKLDALVGAAAARGLTILPVVLHSPTWAADTSAGGDPYAQPPKNPGDYAAFLRTLVARYGPRGSFWAANKQLPKHAIRAWQLWNEPNLPRFWSVQPFAKSYAALLKAGGAAVHQADPAGKVVLAGITNGFDSPSWTALAQLYAAGAKGSFDVIAVHPYTGTAARVIETVKRVRAAARAHGDGRTPIVLTELSWSSGGGGRKGITWDTTEQGQATKLTQVFTALARRRVDLRISGAYWYTWLSRQAGPADGWEFFAGLNRMQGAKVVAKPALTALRVAIRRAPQSP